jgi:CPA2 family monovalent cation:H+ antiporter-2
VLLVGFGRVGRAVAELLKAHDVPFLPVDHNPDEVTKARSQGHHIYYGDVVNPQFLVTCGIEDAPAIIITTNDHATIETIVATIKLLRPDILIISRARDADQARRLYELGVNEVIPETIEASLQLAEASLLKLGVAPSDVKISIQATRDKHRALLQEAAKAAKESRTQ